MTIHELYSIFSKHAFISTDSRKVPEGGLFFALKGDRFNGNEFAAHALENGASFAVIDEPPNINDPRLIRVDNSLKCLQDLARIHRQQSKVKVLAITGSNGKTTTRELCKVVLEKKFRVLATEGNLNNHIGVPLTLLRISNGVQVAIIEMGANHMGEIEELCNIAMPDHGLITNIGKAHLDGFENLEGVARAKSELFDHILKSGGTAFVNFNSPLIRKMVPENYKNRIPYNDRSFYGTVVSADPYLALEINLSGKKRVVHTRLVGDYNLENVVTAARVGSYFKVAVSDIINAIEEYIPAGNRSQLIETDKNTVVMDSYNANPTSMKSAIENFGAMKGTGKVLILGQMCELGSSEFVEHKCLVESLDRTGYIKVILIGEAFEKVKGNYSYYRTVNDAVEDMRIHPLHSSLILVKGSRANQLERLLPWL